MRRSPSTWEADWRGCRIARSRARSPDPSPDCPEPSVQPRTGRRRQAPRAGSQSQESGHGSNSYHKKEACRVALYGVSPSESSAWVVAGLSKSGVSARAGFERPGKDDSEGRTTTGGARGFGLPVLLKPWIAWTLLTEQMELDPRNHLSMVKLATSPHVSAHLFRSRPQIGCDPIPCP